MECVICFSKIFIPKTKEELDIMYKENVKNNVFNELQRKVLGDEEFQKIIIERIMAIMSILRFALIIKNKYF